MDLFLLSTDNEYIIKLLLLSFRGVSFHFVPIKDVYDELCTFSGRQVLNRHRFGTHLT